jgi:hypothetical protein
LHAVGGTCSEICPNAVLAESPSVGVQKAAPRVMSMFE